MVNFAPDKIVVDNFRRDEFWSAEIDLKSLVRNVTASETEIDDFDPVSFWAHADDVFRLKLMINIQHREKSYFEIEMKDLIFMKIRNAFANLLHVNDHVELRRIIIELHDSVEQLASGHAKNNVSLLVLPNPLVK
jgi:hypothetical protein